MEIGDKVHLRSNPLKQGTLLKKVIKNNRIFWSVNFDKQVTQYPESYLQLCEENGVYFNQLKMFAEK